MLTSQLHTAHILSAHAALEQKNKAIQDLKEQKNKCVFLPLSPLACAPLPPPLFALTPPKNPF